MKNSWKRALCACERVAHTRSQMVTLLDYSSGRPYGQVRRRTCEAMLCAGLLDEDQSLLHDDGHGTFKYVLTRRAITEFMALRATYVPGSNKPYQIWLSGPVAAASPAALADRIAEILGIGD